MVDMSCEQENQSYLPSIIFNLQNFAKGLRPYLLSSIF